MAKLGHRKRQEGGERAAEEQAGIMCLGGVIEIRKSVYTEGISTDTHV